MSLLMMLIGCALRDVIFEKLRAEGTVETLPFTLSHV